MDSEIFRSRVQGMLKSIKNELSATGSQVTIDNELDTIHDLLQRVDRLENKQAEAQIREVEAAKERRQNAADCAEMKVLWEITVQENGDS